MLDNVSYDPEYGLWYIDLEPDGGHTHRFNDEPQQRTVVFDRDPTGKIVGIEII